MSRLDSVRIAVEKAGPRIRFDHGIRHVLPISRRT